MQKMRGTALLAAVAMTVTGLAACGDDVEPTEESTSTKLPRTPTTDGPTSTASKTPSSSSDADAVSTELPKAARAKTKAGAIAFTKFYWDEKGKALHTGLTDTLKKYSHDCDVCDTYNAGIDESTAKGVTMNTNPNNIRDLSAVKRPDEGYKVELTIDASKYHEVLSDGSKGRTADAVTYTIVTNTQWMNGHWVINNSVVLG